MNYFELEEKRIDDYTVRAYKNRPKTVYEMFKRTVNRYPENDAIVSKSQSYSYSELYDKVDALSSLLRAEYDVKEGNRILMLLRNSPAFLVTFLAISKIGAVSVILNTRLTKTEIEYQVDKSRPDGIIANSDLWYEDLDKRLDWSIVREQDLDKLLKAEGNETFDYKLEKRGEDDVHTVLFTSGTTGKPKGAKILDRNLIHSAIRQQEITKTHELDMMGKANVLIAAPLFHVLALQEQFIPCIRLGGTAILMEELNVNEYLKLIEEEEVNHLAGSPAMYRLVLRGDIEKYDLSQVKVVAFGGAPMSPDLIDKLEEVFPNAILVNGFGLTEGSVSAIAVGEDIIKNPTSIGKPSRGSEVKIVDDEMSEVPRGTVGEIAIKGPHVVDGYLDPEETKKAFKNGWFLTGDLGKMDEDDFIYVVDRKKDMINRGGENVYSVEVENAIHLHPAVWDVAVYGIPHEIFGEEVAATIVKVPGKEVDGEEIRKFCEDKLAEYKIPKHIEWAEDLPKNPGGKVKKEELKEGLESEKS